MYVVDLHIASKLEDQGEDTFRGREASSVGRSVAPVTFHIRVRSQVEKLVCYLNKKNHAISILAYSM